MSSTTANLSPRLDDHADVLLVPEAAAVLRVSTDTVRALVRANVLPSKRIGRIIRVPKSAIRAYLADEVA